MVASRSAGSRPPAVTIESYTRVCATAVSPPHTGCDRIPVICSAGSPTEALRKVSTAPSQIAGYVVELGTDGRLLALQLDELMAGVDADRTLVIRDYLPVGRKSRTLDEALVELDLLGATELIDLVSVAKAIGYPAASDALDAAVSPRGFRLLAKVPRLPVAVVDRLVLHFGSLQRLLGATVEDLQAVEGVGDARARGVREGLSRLAEASILERYV
ncbi:hypothetical protein ACWD8I_07470 [Micromonospora arida]